MNKVHEVPRRVLRYVLSLLALAAAYIVLGRLGMVFAVHWEHAALVWAPTGLSLAALVLGGLRLWPAVLGGALAVSLSIGTPLLPALGIACGNAVAAVLGAYLLLSVARVDPAFNRVRDVLLFVLFGALTCTLVSATCGIGSLWLADRIDTVGIPAMWLRWWLGSVGGALVAAPAIFVWARGRPSLRTLARRVETWVILATLGVVTTAGFSDLLAGEWRLLASLLMFPLLVWAGLRLGPRGAITVSALVSVFEVIGSSRGGGPFTGDAGLYLTALYLAITALLAAILAAAVAERETAERLRRESEAERALLERQASERQRLEELGMLSGGVAHDFNNLLVPILANADLLRRPGGAESDRRQRLDEIATAAKRAGELCHQLLTYAGKATPEPEPVDLGRLTHEMRRLIESSIAHNVALEEFIEDGVLVYGDSAQLRQLAMNLILNAAESCEERGGTVCVQVARDEVSAEELAHDQLAANLSAGRYAVLEVADDGDGMNVDSVQGIFRPFFTTKFTGRGLGLATVLGVVRAHDGAIVVDTAPGKGARFRIVLPLHNAASEPPADAVPRANPGPVTATVLVADDDEMVQQAIVRVLALAGIETLTAADGVEAVHQFTRFVHEIDLVILDVLMPRMTGARALEAIRARCAHVPAILVSGYTSDQLEHALDENTVFLGKPFTPDQLQDRVLEVLDTRAPAAAKVAKTRLRAS